MNSVPYIGNPELSPDERIGEDKGLRAIMAVSRG